MGRIYFKSNLGGYRRMQSTESKKEDFRKYLEKGGVIDQLTQTLVSLYEEPDKPSNAIDFIKTSLGAPTDMSAEDLKAAHEKLKIEVDNLRAENAMLKEKV